MYGIPNIIKSVALKNCLNENLKKFCLKFVLKKIVFSDIIKTHT